MNRLPLASSRASMQAGLKPVSRMRLLTSALLAFFQIAGCDASSSALSTKPIEEDSPDAQPGSSSTDLMLGSGLPVTPIHDIATPQLSHARELQLVSSCPCVRIRMHNLKTGYEALETVYTHVDTYINRPVYSSTGSIIPGQAYTISFVQDVRYASTGGFWKIHNDIYSGSFYLAALSGSLCPPTRGWTAGGGGGLPTTTYTCAIDPPFPPAAPPPYLPLYRTSTAVRGHARAEGIS